MNVMKFEKAGPKLTRNAARCKGCDTIVESKTRNDFRACACGKVAVDGGLSARKAFGDPDLIEDLCEYESS